MKGPIQKMVTRLDKPVSYQLPMGDGLVDLNPLIGTEIALTFCGSIFCIECGRKTSKSFNQGYCYPCFKKLAACDQCIVKPELCHFHLGTCREPEWGEANCFGPHVVYLANSSGLKVGITRASQVPTRWIDQGATQALPIFEVADRRTAGLLESTLRTSLSDRTDWRKMLKGEPDPLDLVAIRGELASRSTEILEKALPDSDHAKVAPAKTSSVCQIQYPVTRYPEKIKTHNFDKDQTVAGRLSGIKGQYLILRDVVFNVRKFAGYDMQVEC